jgi:hypothetical protein
VNLQGAARVVCKVAPEFAVSVQGDDNLLSHITTEVKGNTLVIGQDANWKSKEGITVSVSGPDLREMILEGSGQMVATGISGSDFKISVGGSGEVRVEGKVDDVDVSLAGSGSIQTVGLQSGDASVDISGSGHVSAFATEAATVNISGSGVAEIHGGAKVTKSISGSGVVREV